MDDVAGCGLRRLCTGLHAGGGGSCEWQAGGAAGCADNVIGRAGAASLAPSLGGMTQLTSLGLRGTLRASAQLRCERVLANAGNAWMMDDATCCGLGLLCAWL